MFIYAICPNCGKSIYLEQNIENFYNCPFCKQPFSYDELMSKGFIINSKRAQAEYEEAQKYFNEGNYAEAKIRFNLVRSYDRNNFFAEYYYILCGIYEINKKRELGGESIVLLIEKPLEKLEKTSVSDNIKLYFIINALTQIQVLLLDNINRLKALFEHSSNLDELRANCLNLAKNMRRLLQIDVNKLFSTDKNVATVLEKICDNMIDVLQTAVRVRFVGGNKLELPTAEVFRSARGLFGIYYQYVQRLNPKYAYIGYVEGYAANLHFNDSVNNYIDVYDSVNKKMHVIFYQHQATRLTK